MKLSIASLSAGAASMFGSRERKPASGVGYVFAIPAGDLVGIYGTYDLTRDVNAVMELVPSARPGYILAVAGDPKMVAALAEGNLAHKAAGGGWYFATLAEAQAAIDASAEAYTGIKPFHTTSDAMIATRRNRR